MGTVTERLEALEERARKAEKAAQAAGVLGVTLLQEALDQLVDDRIISARTRFEIWRRMRPAIGFISTLSIEMVDAANGASPRYDKPKITE